MTRCRGSTGTGWLLIALLLAFASDAALAGPSIVGSATDVRCRVTLDMSKAAFNGRSFSLDWPIPAPAPPARIILRQREADISGGNGIEADPSKFLTLHQSLAKDYATTIFWSRKAFAGKRLAIVDTPFNWRGDWYTTYLVGSDESPELFIRQLAAEEANRPAELKPVLGANRWNPPTVLTNGTDGSYWIIDRGEPYEAMPDWRVFVPTRAAAHSPCRISFGKNGERGLAHMPAAVRRLAAELDEALGPGTDEGTLQPTAAIRVTVARAWANAAVRPWALTAEPYNSRVKVERSLAEWAKASRVRAGLLSRIKHDYPAAHRALATYYATQSTHTPAEKTASRVLDYMFRTYFVFPKASTP
jgi:hypothetical protein